MKVPLLKDVTINGERFIAGHVIEISPSQYKSMVDDGTIPTSPGYIPECARVPSKPPPDELQYPVTLTMPQFIDNRTYAPGDVVLVGLRRLRGLAEVGAIDQSDCPPGIFVAPAVPAEPPSVHLVKVKIKHARLVGNAWHEVNDIVAVPEDLAENLVERGDARYLDPAASRRKQTPGHVIELGL